MELNAIIFPSPKYDKKKVTLFQEELIYIPNPNNLDDFIPCLFLPDTSSAMSKNFMIMFHGNAEDIFNARNVGDDLKSLLHMNVIIVEYPSYSIYEGPPDTDKILDNTLIVYDFIKKTFGVSDNNIYIFGRSIGTSPAIYLASKRNPNALISVSAFTSIRAVANNLVGFLDILLKDRLLSSEYIKKVKCPTLFIHGQSDPLIPFRETLRLKENCSCPFEVILPYEMTHNEYDIECDIIDPIKKFLRVNCVVDREKNMFGEKGDVMKKMYKTPESIKEYMRKKDG